MKKKAKKAAKAAGKKKVPLEDFGFASAQFPKKKFGKRKPKVPTK